MSSEDIIKSIGKYAQAYEELQNWQDSSALIPKGDQKTGCIGEFYAYIYLKNKYPVCEIIYGGHSEKGWDIKVKSNNFSERIQVKTVSEYSTTRVISPIHHGWNQLFIIYLDRGFKPQGFWIIDDISIAPQNKVLKNRKCMRPGNNNSGSKDIPFGQNRVAEIISAVQRECSA